MKNLPEFKALIERYESVTIEDIVDKWGDDNDASFTAGLLTGYGSAETCTLCKAVNVECYACVWRCLTSSLCSCDRTNTTYWDIMDATTPTELLTAFRARAAYMRKVLKDGGIE